MPGQLVDGGAEVTATVNGWIGPARGRRYGDEIINAPSLIETLWSGGLLPIKDGLYRADGCCREVLAGSHHPGGLKIVGSFSLAALIAAESDYVTWVDVTVERELHDSSGWLFCGEGSHGSEGLFGRLDAARNLVWVVYLEDSNPFVDVVVDHEEAVFESSSGLIVKVDLTGAHFGL